MGNLKKILAVLLLSIIVSVNLIGCDKKDQKYSASKPQKENVQNEHPSDDKASSEHPEHPSKEHGKSEHPEHPSKENEKSEHPEHPTSFRRLIVLNLPFIQFEIIGKHTSIIK